LFYIFLIYICLIKLKQKQKIMKNLQTQTVLEYNKSQTNPCMRFRNNDGSLTIRGYVVTFEDQNKLYRNKQELSLASEKDFEREECPIWWVDGWGTKESYNNS
jgi:hypothetical protein